MANPNQFNSILVQSPKRNKFNLSYENKLTAQIGRLTPVAMYEVLPGDTFSMQTQCMVRMQALLAPLMHRIDVYFHNFYVPNRIVWDKWEDFITQDPENPTISLPRLSFPSGTVLQAGQKHLVSNGSNLDYFGLPSVSVREESVTFRKTFTFDEIPFRGLAKIYNDYYRDENLQDEIPVYESSSGIVSYGADNDSTQHVQTLLSPLYRAWEKDYFTSALPDTQLGGEIALPIRGLLEVGAFNTDRSRILPYASGNANGELNYFYNKNNYSTPVDGELMATQKEFQNGVALGFTPSNGGADEYLASNMGVDLSDAVKITINELRKTVALQSWLERSYVGGTRYKESILAHYGVLVPDGRLQRPEYLGGGKQNIVISPVVQQSATVENQSALGSMAGYGVSTSSSNRWKAYFPEHGYVITIMSIMPKPSYQNLLTKEWTKSDVLDFYFPEFAHLGEEEILNREVWYDFTKAEPNTAEEKSDAVFGYTPRYATYKFKLSEVHGEFKDSLDYWTMTRKFENQPKLNVNFIRCDGSQMNNVFAIQPDITNDYPFIVHLFHDTRAWRGMPVYATPKLVG